MNAGSATVEGPFGTARHALSLDVDTVVAMYKMQYGVDVGASFSNHSSIDLYQCERTGFRFWRPKEIAGNEAFYRDLSGAWATYYRDWRWEYGQLDDEISPTSRVIEVGCGKGYFLQYLQGKVAHAEGVEFNREAITNKVTTWDVQPMDISEAAERFEGTFDLVCHFQVLEHVVEPRRFLEESIRLLKPAGRLVFSVPNHEYVPHALRKDAFDLPPHHVNHFTPASLDAIGKEMGMDVVRIRAMPRPFTPEETSPNVSNNNIYRAARRLSYEMLNLVYKVLGEPGHTVIAVFRKPAH
jgi:SAM-dependent methyltransferase